MIPPQTETSPHLYVEAPPKVEPPKVEPPKVEPPKVEPPKVEPPKVEPPKVVEEDWANLIEKEE